MSKQKPKVVLTPLAGGKTQFEVTGRDFRLSDGDLSDDSSLKSAFVLNAMVTPPRMKIAAAAYFLRRAKEYQNNEAATLAYVEAFIQSARSATFALQKACAHSEGFSDWWTSPQKVGAG